MYVPRLLVGLRAALASGILALAACDSGSPTAALDVRYVVAGAATVTYTDAAGPSQATAAGAWEHRFTAAPGATLTIEAASTDGAPVTVHIEVGGALFRADSGLRVRLDARLGDDGSQGEAEVEGPVAGRGADRLTVLGFVFLVDGQTRVLGYDGGPVPFSTIAVGDFVEVRARPRGDGTLLATEVKREDGSGNEVEVHGAIEALDAASVTVRGLRFATDAATRWLDDDDRPVGPEAFHVGDLVEAKGHVRGDGSLYAEEVEHDDDD